MSSPNFCIGVQLDYQGSLRIALLIWLILSDDLFSGSQTNERFQELVESAAKL